jgi:hypothetical protein
MSDEAKDLLSAEERKDLGVDVKKKTSSPGKNRPQNFSRDSNEIHGIIPSQKAISKKRLAMF